MDNAIIPTADNTVAEIKAYLDNKGIKYPASAIKADLLALIPVETPETPVEEVPAEPIKPEPIRYTKEEWVMFTSGATQTWLVCALKKGKSYTWQETQDAVWEFKKGMF